MTPTKIVPFDPATHDLANFRTGVGDVDKFFSSAPGTELNLRVMSGMREAEILVAVRDGEAVGCVALRREVIPSESAHVYADDLRRSGRADPEGKSLPVVRIVVLGVRCGMHGRGVGTQLLGKALADAGPIPAYYYLFAREEAECFYEKRGFTLNLYGKRVVMVKFPTVSRAS